MGHVATYDIAHLKAGIDLVQLARRYSDLREWTTREWAGPCPHAHCTADTDGFHVHGDGWFKCYQCHPKRADVVEFVQWLGLAHDFREACTWLEAYRGGSPAAARPDARRVDQPRVSRCAQGTDRQWQEEAQAIVVETSARLERPEGEPGRAYLATRGIRPATWQAWGWGYDPTKYDPVLKRTRPAIVMPWYFAQQISAVKYRFMDSQTKGDRFTQKGGGEQKLFGTQMLGRHGAVLILCEGEFNALAIWQGVQDLGYQDVDVASFGSESAAGSAAAVALAQRYRRVVVWVDERQATVAALRAIPAVFGLQSILDDDDLDNEGRPTKLDANALLQRGMLNEYLRMVLQDCTAPPQPAQSRCTSHESEAMVAGAAAASDAQPTAGQDEPVSADPRPDLLADHARWTVLLSLAYTIDGVDPQGAFGALFGIRCCGAQIISEPAPLDLTPEGPALRWRLERGEIDADEWVRLRREWLVPHTEVLQRLLSGPR